MKHAACALATVLCLSACNKGPEVNLNNATQGQVAQAVKQSGLTKAGFTIQPGEWESKLTIQQMDIPGMSPQMAAQMKTQMADSQAHTSRQCLTPEQVKQPKADFFTGQDKSCKYQHFTMGAGKIDIQLVCQEGEGAAVTNMTGTYTPTSYSMDMSSNDTGGESGRAVSMKMHVDSRRVGECTGKDED